MNGLNFHMAYHPVTIHLALIAHTNAGKTTLARTLLSRDIGEVRDAPHVTDLAEAHVLIESEQGDSLRLWDTPGFGDSTRLARRLAVADNPIGWLLREVWDRFRDRPLWCSQHAVRAAREQADVLLYLVNAAEDPRDAGYVVPEMQVLGWVGKPIIVLLNQTGPPRPAEEEREEIERWREYLSPFVLVADVLALDAFARLWIHERVLFEAVGRVVPAPKRHGYARLLTAWETRNRTRYDEAMRLLAKQTLAAAIDSESIELSPATAFEKVLRTVGAGDMRETAAHKRAMHALSARIDQGIGETTDALIVLHGLQGEAARTVLERMRENFALPPRLDEGRTALFGGVLTGALTGLKADLAAGGLTFGAGALIGGVLGGLGAAGVARGFNKMSGATKPRLRWSDEFLDDLVRANVLRYLAVAHFGRGRGRWTQGEAPAFWRTEVERVVAAYASTLHRAWDAARASTNNDGDMPNNAHSSRDASSIAGTLIVVYESVTADVLARLYPANARLELARPRAAADNAASRDTFAPLP
ncbi:MAG TPA: GTPase domain-containing protein [Burkholderiaceae bacterium]|nr:GTPase domain-containing protein [Burkholderiaceae bacterium]